jgi:membrane-bound serine protease (ClpP class)
VRNAASLPANDALAKGVIDFIAGSPQDLLKQADGRTVRVGAATRTLHTAGATLVDIKPDWRADILSVITDPNIAYLLLLAGIYGLLFEFLNPGAVAPGVVGAIALLIGLYALNLLPINYAGAGLMLLGIALMITEAFLPTFGVVGIGGIAAFAIGSLLMFDAGVPGFGLSWSVVGAATAASVLFVLFAIGVVWRAHRRKVVTGEEALIGHIARVVNWDGDHGHVHLHGEDWRAQSAATLAPGQPVRVIARKDLTLIIEPAAPPQPSG